MNADDKRNQVELFTSRITHIPTIPKVLTQIMAMADDPKVEIEQIADAILKDKVLTARMIRMVNSAFWGIRREIVSIREAIVYLGLEQVKNIVTTVSLFNVFQSKNPNFRVAAIWEHGLGCAMISRRIAEMIGFKDLEKAYLGGLLHDIGEVVLSQFSIDEFNQVVDLVKSNRVSFYDAENQVLGISHADFGDWFKEHWGFSEELAEVITMHHTPEKARLNPDLVSIVVLANLFCNVRGLDYHYAYLLQVAFQDEYAWQELAKKSPILNKVDLARFTLDLDDMVDEVKRLVKAVYRES
jgi:putative nucleotidyltransferase with HDIG domain